MPYRCQPEREETVMRLTISDDTPHVSGGVLCLGIVNTVLWRRSSTPVEQLKDYSDLVRFVARAGWLESPDELVSASRAHPRRAGAAFARAIALRERLFRLLSAVAAGYPPQSGDLVALNASLSESLRHLRVGTGDVVEPLFRVSWADQSDLDLPRWQVAASASALLASDLRYAIKQCPGDQCGWVFVDESRNQSRRWCSSSMCGNRARARAHYERTRIP
jgi:predicted RNA-binding Zn ribbon-like protein